MSPVWKKYGLVIQPIRDYSWSRSHAMMPTPLQLEDSKYRIYFGSRNSQNQSHIGYVEIDLKEPTKIIEYSKEPALSPGRLGTFDDNGVLASCVLRVKSEIYLYYVGFKPGGTTRMDLFGGLAISYDSGRTFERWSEAPVIERNPINPFINTAPWVLHEDNKFTMYFVAGREWLNPDLPRYHIQIATSNDGKYWLQQGKVAIDFQDNENALARPYVINDNKQYSMWFSSKGEEYSAQYAISRDGYSWQRRHVGNGIEPNLSGVDDQMVCYPIVLKFENKQYMFYNGNQYGQQGICLAVADCDETK